MVSNKYSTTVKKRRSKWHCVANSLPLLIQLRKEEKERRRDIEMEAEDLRMVIRKMQMSECAKYTGEV